MQSLDTPLAAFEVSSVALGYRALDVISRADQIRILEASPISGGRFFILCSGPAAALQSTIDAVRSAFGTKASEVLIDSVVVEKQAGAIGESLFSLAQVELGESLIVVECKTISGLLASAEAMLSFEGIDPIEMKIHRGGTTGGYGFFSSRTSIALPAAEEVRTRLKSAYREGDVQVIENPVAAFRQFFNFSGVSS